MQAKFVFQYKSFLFKKNILKKFQENLVDSVNKIKVGNQLHKDTDVGPLIRPREVDRIDE